MLPPNHMELLDGYKNKTPYICCLQETHLKLRDTYRLTVRGWKVVFLANENHNKAGAAILISDKINTITETKDNT